MRKADPDLAFQWPHTYWLGDIRWKRYTSTRAISISTDASTNAHDYLMYDLTEERLNILYNNEDVDRKY